MLIEVIHHRKEEPEGIRWVSWSTGLSGFSWWVMIHKCVMILLEMDHTGSTKKADGEREVERWTQSGTELSSDVLCISGVSPSTIPRMVWERYRDWV